MMRIEWDMAQIGNDIGRVWMEVPDDEVKARVEAVTKLGFEPSVSMV